MSEQFIGEIRPFSFNYAPRGWLPCNGQTLAIATNQALFSILGTTYGGDGRVTFMLPNLQGSVPIGFNNDFPLGAKGGEAAHALTIAEMPVHSHLVSCNGSAGTSASPSANFHAASNLKEGSQTDTVDTPYAGAAGAQMNAGAIQNGGASTAHNNLQPYQVLNFCIATVGIYPSRS